MDVSALLLELYGRVLPLASDVVEGLDGSTLVRPPAPRANPIAWLIWHLTRVQDHHVAELLEADQVWEHGQWAAGVGLDPDPGNTGYGHSAAQVAEVRPESADVLLGYLGAVDARTRTLLASLTAADLDRVVDRRWDPPVTMGVRLVSIADDCLQHAGQAAYVRGLLERDLTIS
jgi:DinB superfamily